MRQSLRTLGTRRGTFAFWALAGVALLSSHNAPGMGALIGSDSSHGAVIAAITALGSLVAAALTATEQAASGDEPPGHMRSQSRCSSAWGGQPFWSPC